MRYYPLRIVGIRRGTRSRASTARDALKWFLNAVIVS